MPQKIIVYWRDIPSQVTIQQGRTKGKWLMSQRFQEAIDRAAIRAGKADTDSYVAEWRRETSDYACDGELEACARAEVALLDAGTSQSVVGVAVDLGSTDSLLNVQHDGTTRALFILDTLDPVTTDAVGAAADELVEHLGRLGDLTVARRLVGGA